MRPVLHDGRCEATILDRPHLRVLAVWHFEEDAKKSPTRVAFDHCAVRGEDKRRIDPTFKGSVRRQDAIAPYLRRQGTVDMRVPDFAFRVVEQNRLRATRNVGGQNLADFGDVLIVEAHVRRPRTGRNKDCDLRQERLSCARQAGADDERWGGAEFVTRDERYKECEKNRPIDLGAERELAKHGV